MRRLMVVAAVMLMGLGVTIAPVTPVQVARASSSGATVLYHFASGGSPPANQLSHDDGQTFTSLIEPTGGAKLAMFSVKDAQTIYALREATAFGSAGEVYLSTDGGTSFSLLGSVPVTSTQITRNVFTRMSDGSLLVGIADLVSVDAGYIARSTDNGATWTNHLLFTSQGDLFNYAIQEDPTHPGTVYVMNLTADGNTTPTRIYRSTDYGQTWAVSASTDTVINPVTAGPNWAFVGFYITRSGVFLLEGAQLLPPFNRAVFRSTDGVAFSGVFSPQSRARVQGPNPFSEVVNNTGTPHPGRVVLEGQYFSDDGGSSWSPLATAADGITANGFSADAIFASGGSGLYRSTDAGNSWTHVVNGGGNDTGYQVVASFAVPAVSFAAFSARVDIVRSAQAFDARGTFTLGAGGSFDLSKDPVTIQLQSATGSTSITIPPGSFQLVRGRYVFFGTLNNMFVEGAIAPRGGSNYAYEIGAAGDPSVVPITNPVTVTLTIGNNSGSATVTANII